MPSPMFTVSREPLDGSRLAATPSDADLRSEDAAVRLAASHLRQNAASMGLRLQSVSEIAGSAPAFDAAKLDLRLSEKKMVGDTAVISYDQYAAGLPVWRAGVTVRVDLKKLKVTGVEDALRLDVDVHEVSVDEAARTITPEVLGAAVGLGPDAAIEIHECRPLVFQFVASKRLGEATVHDDTGKRERSTTFPPISLADLDGSIEAQRDYIAIEVMFSARVQQWGLLNWRAFVEPRTGSVLYLRALVSCASARVFRLDPVSASGDPTLTTAADFARLQVLAQPVPLQGLRAIGGPQALSGDFVQLRSWDEPPRAMPAEADPFKFDYECNTLNFAACSAYHHCDSTFRWLEDLGLDLSSVLKRTDFPIWVDPMAFNREPNALASGNRKGILEGLKFGAVLHDQDFGLATDPRVVMHEIAHGFLMEHIGSPNFGFAHSAGDALAAIMMDPESIAPDVGDTYPFIQGIPGFNRRHDRDARLGWGWRGHEYDTDYGGEQVLSSSLFRAYRAAGGASSRQAERVYASRRMCFLIVTAISKLTRKHANPQPLIDALQESDREYDYEGYPAGTYQKLFQWAFERQGFGLPPSARDVDAFAKPPGADLYIDNGMGGDYLDGHDAYPRRDWRRPPGLWNRVVPDGLPGHQAAVAGVVNFAYLRVGNRGASRSRKFKLRAFASRAAAPVWPADWNELDVGALGDQDPLAAGAGNAKIIGPVRWTPNARSSGLLAYLSGADDTSTIEDVTSGAIDLERIVRTDNNIALRKI